MKSYELVAATIRGENKGPVPVYGWIFDNLTDQLIKSFGSVENFEDKYEFDMAHIFGGPYPFDTDTFKKLRYEGIEITPDVLLDIPLNPVNNIDDYKTVISDLKHHREDRGRFCYIQTPGIFECLNDPFTIENHLMYLALYPDELKKVYARQAKWNKEFVENMIELGIDMVHISDDWGAQNSLMFNPKMWSELIYPYHKVFCDAVKKTNTFLSLHSDGYIAPILDGIIELGYDLVHPWQESSGMSYDLYLEKYSDKLALLGGLCVQTTLGFGDYKNLEREIKRVFNLLKGKRWIFCTTHFVQAHCEIEELVFAYELATKLARG